MMQRPVRRKPGVSKQANTARQIPLNSHLLHVQKGDLFPAGPVARRRGRKAGVQVGSLDHFDGGLY